MAEVIRITVHELLKTRRLPGYRVEYGIMWTYCGNPCCGACPHGPYWYARGRTRGKWWTKCVGRDRPPGMSQAMEARVLDAAYLALLMREKVW